jgi:magnesium chelatase subunit D
LNREAPISEGAQIFATPPAVQLKHLEFHFPRFSQGKRGRRLATPTRSRHGRYVKPRLPDTADPDVALDATLRAAVGRDPELFQDHRPLTHADLRYKRRVGKTQALLLLVVDASGSMSAQRRMSAAKQLALSFLVQAYQRRDRVGMIVFHGAKARVLLPPTNSVALAHKKLRVLPTGGKTPLAHGLYLAYQMAKRELRRQKSLIPIIVVISDGNPNVPCFSQDPKSDAFKVAGAIARRGLPALFVDTNTNFMEHGLGLALAKAMHCPYERFETIAANLGLGHLLSKKKSALFYWSPD